MFGDKDYSDVADALLEDFNQSLEDILEHNDLTPREALVVLIEQGLIDIEAYHGIITRG